MTTIAFDGHRIAADGQRTWGGEIRGLNFQKLRRRGDVIYAFTGLVPLFEPMIKWHQDGASAADLPKAVDHKEDGWTLVVVSDGKLVKYTSNCPYVEEFEAPIAFGAGADYAIGAMLAGADARRAVEVVSSICYHTGGAIQVIEVAPTLAIKEAAE